MKGFDSATPLSAEKAKELCADGYNFAIRYYSHNPEKNLTRAEAQGISDAGMPLIVVWEAQGNLYSSFGRVQGAADAAAAMQQARACGQPTGTTIFFAVDFDATQAQIDAGITDYFDSTKQTLAAEYLNGSYGSPLVNASMVAKGLTARSWEAQSTGWAGDHSALEDMTQGREVTLDGIDVDTDSTSETAAKIGAWSLPPAAPVQPPSPRVAPDVRDLIKQLQAALGVAADGIPGPQTIGAIEKWQEANP